MAFSFLVSAEKEVFQYVDLLEFWKTSLTVLEKKKIPQSPASPWTLNLSPGDPNIFVVKIDVLNLPAPASSPASPSVTDHLQTLSTPQIPLCETRQIRHG